MIKEFIPDLITKDIYDIDYDKLYEDGIRLLVFDIDGTILKSLNFNISEKLIELFATLKRRNFTIVLLTNAGTCRLNPVLEKIKVEGGFASAKKPKLEAFERVLESHIFEKEQIAMIGNDLYADIYGANKFGIMSIFVESLDLGLIENKINNFVLTKMKLFQKKRNSK